MPTFRRAMLSLGLTLLASTAGAQTWSSVPTAQQLAAAYPSKARDAKLAGEVNLSCSVNRQGHTHDCLVLGEKPTGYGFGAAARTVARGLQSDAAMAGDDVRVAVTFDPQLLTGEPLTITRPVWVAMPAAQDFQATFPKTQNGVNNVRVVLACSVQVAGTLGDCSVASEEPAGQGYGDGALALAGKFKVGPWSQDGQPTAGAHIRLPIRYALQQVEAPKN